MLYVMKLTSSNGGSGVHVEERLVDAVTAIGQVMIAAAAGDTITVEIEVREEP